MLDTLNEVKQLVDLSVEADSDLIRYKATNRILLKMWKYFRKLLEELKQECQEPEENGEQQQETQEQPPDKKKRPRRNSQEKNLQMNHLKKKNGKLRLRKMDVAKS